MGARCLGASGFARVALGVRGGGEMGDDGYLNDFVCRENKHHFGHRVLFFGFLRGECGAYVHFCMSGIGKAVFFCRICIIHLCYCSGIFCNEMDGIESSNFSAGNSMTKKMCQVKL